MYRLWVAMGPSPQLTANLVYQSEGFFSFSSADNVCLHVSCESAFFYLFSAIEDDDYLLYETCKCAQVHSTIAGADYCFDCENRAHVNLMDMTSVLSPTQRDYDMDACHKMSHTISSIIVRFPILTCRTLDASSRWLPGGLGHWLSVLLCIASYNITLYFILHAPVI